MTPGIKKLVSYSLAVLVASIGYYSYVRVSLGAVPEQESFLGEIGEGLGELALWGFGVIYLRTLVKLVMGKGAISRRLLPNYSAPDYVSMPGRFIALLDRTHIYFGIATVALVVLHIAMLGLPLNILFFPAVLVLVIWQALFGMFLSWKYSPKELRKFSFLVHAQLVTGVMIGIFAWFGHLLVDD